MKSKTKNNFLAISVGLVYLWFGALKFFPGLSPAEGLAKSTIHELTFGIIPDNISIILLAIWEVGVGLLLITNFFRKTTIYIALAHMVFTFAPLLFFPNDTFNDGPLYLTLLGQYIIKNLIIIAALLVLLETQTGKVYSDSRKTQTQSETPKFKFSLQKLLQRN